MGPILQLNNIYRKQHTYHKKKKKKKNLKQKFDRNIFTGNLKYYKKKIPKTSKILNHNVRICSNQGSRSFKKHQRISKNAAIIIDLSHNRFECLHSKFFIQEISQNKKKLIINISKEILIKTKKLIKFEEKRFWGVLIIIQLLC